MDKIAVAQGDFQLAKPVAAIFYVEPFTTYDLDVFCVFGNSGAGLTLLTPIYEYLIGKGYNPDKETVNIEGWPVQFLPVFNPLVEEAVENANEFDYEGTPVRVMPAEHLIAIMLQTGRPKDYVRISRFVEVGVFDDKSLTNVLFRHKLTSKWKDYKQRFIK